MDFILKSPLPPATLHLALARRFWVRQQMQGPGSQPGVAQLPLHVRHFPERLQQGSKRTASVEPKVSQSEAEGMFSGSQTASRRLIWSKHRTKFLTNYLMRQASDGKGKDALFKEDTLREVAEAVSQQFQRECWAADIQRRLTALREKWRRVERIKSLGSASWHHATRTICIREEDYQQYALDHSKDSGLLSRPIQDYDELSFIFGDEYDPSAAEIQLERDRNTHSDDSKIPEDPMEQKIAHEDIRYLVA